jgi:hypothetical protein
MSDDFVVVSTDHDGKLSAQTVTGAEACSLLIIQLIRAGHTGIHNYIVDAPPATTKPAKTRPLTHWAVLP